MEEVAVRDCRGHAEQYLEAVRLKGATVMRYAVVIEKADENYSAYVPDLPGCIATGDSVAAVESEIREAIRFHIDGLRADGIAVPQPTSIAEYVET
jgi:predicted RNase H-like HicB family nuclease